MKLVQREGVFLSVKCCQEVTTGRPHVLYWDRWGVAVSTSLHLQVAVAGSVSSGQVSGQIQNLPQLVLAQSSALHSPEPEPPLPYQLPVPVHIRQRGTWPAAAPQHDFRHLECLIGLSKQEIAAGCSQFNPFRSQLPPQLSAAGLPSDFTKAVQGLHSKLGHVWEPGRGIYMGRWCWGSHG